MSAKIKFRYEHEGERTLKKSIVTESQTWMELLVDFAEILTSFPEAERWVIDLEILEEHLENSRREQAGCIFGRKDNVRG